VSLLLPELERQLRDVVDGRLGSPQAPHAPWRAGARVALIAAAVVPALAIAVLAVALLGRHAKAPSKPASPSAPHRLIGTARHRLIGPVGGGMCAGRAGAVSMDARTGVVAHSPEATRQVLGGTIAGYRWSLQAKAGEAGFPAIQDGRLILNRRAYGMCGPGASSPAFGLIDAPGHGIVYGYVTGRRPLSVRLSGPGVPTNGVGAAPRVIPIPGGGGDFLMGALPASACSYKSLKLYDTEAPGIQLVDTAKFGACRLDQPVPPITSSGVPSNGGSPSGLGHVTPVATIKLHPPTGAGAARGTAHELRAGAHYGITITATGVTPNTPHNAYAVWLYRSPSKERLLGFINPGVRQNGRLTTVGALPNDASAYDKILIALETRPNPRVPGLIVLTGTGTLR
jgi:hypothetical protein